MTSTRHMHVFHAVKSVNDYEVMASAEFWRLFGTGWVAPGRRGLPHAIRPLEHVRRDEKKVQAPAYTIS